MEKKYPIGGYAPGDYQCKCFTCSNTFYGDKRAIQCEDCAVNDLREALKPYDHTPAELERGKGAVWVKASERLPGWGQYVSWRHESGKELPGKQSVNDMTDRSPMSLHGFEWLDESPIKDEWISVDERLPYKDGDSSIYCLVNDTYDGIVVRPFNEAHNCWDQEDGDDYYTDAKGGKITHWRPLPPPPKPKK